MKVNLVVYISMVVSPLYLNASQNQLLHLCINAAVVNPVIIPLLQLSREDSYSASTNLWWVFADQQFWTAWVRHRQSCSHTGDCETSRHHTHSHTTKRQALAEKKGGRKTSQWNVCEVVIFTVFLIFRDIIQVGQDVRIWIAALELPNVMKTLHRSSAPPPVWFLLACDWKSLN